MKKLLLLAVFSLAALLAGCGTLQIDLENDGSGELTYKIPLDDSYYTMKEIESEIEDYVKDINKENDDEVVKIKKIIEKDDVATVVLEVKDMAATSDVIHAPVKEVSRIYLDELLKLEDEDGKKLDKKKVEDIDDAIVFVMDADDMMESTEINLPGKVLYVSDGVDIVDKNTISTDESEIAVVYENGGSKLFIPLLILAIIVVIGIGYKVVSGRKNNVPKIETSNTMGDKNNA